MKDVTVVHTFDSQIDTKLTIFECSSSNRFRDWSQSHSESANTALIDEVWVKELYSDCSSP